MPWTFPKSGADPRTSKWFRAIEREACNPCGNGSGNIIREDPRQGFPPQRRMFQEWNSIHFKINTQLPFNILQHPSTLFHPFCIRRESHSVKVLFNGPERISAKDQVKVYTCLHCLQCLHNKFCWHFSFLSFLSFSFFHQQVLESHRYPVFCRLSLPSFRQMLDVLGVQANELEEVWYVLDDGDNRLTIKESW